MGNPQVVLLNTAGLGRIVGYSTQQVRDLERLGVIPRAERGSNGYRRFDHRHVVALRAYRALAAVVGPVTARGLMPALVAGSVEEAAEAIDELHAVIARDRSQVREALRALDAVLADVSDIFEERDIMTIGELARAIDVRASTLRHWEAERLVRPDRTTASSARRYGAAATAEARIVAALRLGGYRIPPIRETLEQLRAHVLTTDARLLLNDRLADLTRRSVLLLAGAAHLHELLVPGLNEDRVPPNR